MSSPQIRYPNAVFGGTAGDPVLYGDVIGYFVTSGTVAAGNVVIVDTSNLGQVKAATASADGHLVVGIAAEAGVANDVICVTLAGRTTATSNTAITAGDRVGPDATTAGNVATVTAATAVTQAKDVGNVVAIALETVTSGVSSVRVFVQKV